jgi:hypothetical protein
MNSPPFQDDRLIDFKETAHLLGDISERSVRRLIARGELPPQRSQALSLRSSGVSPNAQGKTTSQPPIDSYDFDHFSPQTHQKMASLMSLAAIRGRYRLDEGDKLTDIPLDTTDKRVARERLQRIVREKQLEAVGVLSPHRTAFQTPLEKHLSDYLADLQAVGRD